MITLISSYISATTPFTILSIQLPKLQNILLNQRDNREFIG